MIFTPEQLRTLELTTRKLLAGRLSGDYRTSTKGSGFEFDQLRDYQLGDDIRCIDWKSSARANKMFVRQYVEERNRTIYILFDRSASSEYTSHDQSVSSITKQLAGIFAFMGLYQKNPVGLIAFDQTIKQVISPVSSRGGIVRLITELMALEPGGTGTCITSALVYLLKRVTKRSLVLVLSDFLAPLDPSLLALAAHRHELIFIRCSDPYTREFPAVGLLSFQDSETGKRILLDTSKLAPDLEAWWSLGTKRCRQAGIDLLDLQTHEPYMARLAQFLKHRKHI